MENGQKFYLPSNDYIFKALMTRNVDLLRDFLGSVLPGIMEDFAAITVEHADLLGESTDSKIYKLDLVVKTRTGNTINIEMQVCHEAGLENRMQLYLARSHSLQLDSGESYSKPHCTYSIWLCKFKLHDDDSHMHDFVLYDPENQLVFPNSIHLIQLELPKFDKATGSLHDWLKFFAANTEEEVMSMAVQNEKMEQAATFVHYMNMTPRERALAEAHARDMYEKKAAYAEGIAEGEAQGLQSVARSMLQAGEPRAKIIQFTRLTDQELDALL